MITQGYLLGERYKIIDTLGEGGMANIYLAEDIILQRKVAVKVLRFDLQKDPQTVQRFQREALSTSELSHPNIVSVFDVDSDHGIPYMVMEYVSGPNLKDYIHDHSPLEITKVIRIMDQILSAMTLAHQHNMIHRDLKPQNILMDPKGNIKIADFGIAVALNQNAITQTNSAMGSVHYMSPEQARGGVVTKQSDIYSLGIILYELISGQVPFGGETAVSIALKHVQEPVPSLRKQNAKIPQALENVVFHATAKDPRDRYASVFAMKKDLDTSLSPSRRNESVFEAKHHPESDETIVLPPFKGTVTSTIQKIPKEESDSKIPKNPKKDEKKKFWEQLKKHKWWWLGSALAIIVILVILISALSHRHDILVPDLADMTQAQAKTALTSSGLKMGTKQYEHSSTVKKGHVIRTDPAAGVAVKSGGRVALTLSSGRGLTKVPDVTGESFSSAKKELQAKGFSVAREEDYSSDVDEGDVISQDVAAGTKVKADQTTITLIVSKGSRPRKTAIKLRDLTGYSQKSAQDYAQENGLSLRITMQASSGTASGNVLSQNPAPGTIVHRGDVIDLTVSSGSSNQSSDSSDSSSSSSASSNQNVTRSFTVSYDQDQDNDGKGNHVQIYISDDDHSLSNVYRDLYIKKDQNFSIPFKLAQGAGHLKVIRDGQTVLDESVTNGNN